MVLIVDFNMVEEDGRIPALLPADNAGALSPGTKIIAADSEGTECYAIIDEIAPDGRYAMLTPIEGTVRHNSILPGASDLLAR